MKKSDIICYSYRIEFQKRGMPHAHGIAWLKKEVISKYLNHDGSYNDRIHELIEQYMCCSLENNQDSLNGIYKTTKDSGSRSTNSDSDSNYEGKMISISFFRFKLIFTLLIFNFLEESDQNDSDVSTTMNIEAHSSKTRS